MVNVARNIVADVIILTAMWVGLVWLSGVLNDLTFFDLVLPLVISAIVFLDIGLSIRELRKDDSAN